jgi:hypothetical protein
VDRSKQQIKANQDFLFSIPCSKEKVIAKVWKWRENGKSDESVAM